MKSMRSMPARAAALLLALLLAAGYALLPVTEEQNYVSNSGRKKAEIPTDGELTWEWKPETQSPESLTLTLSGKKKAAGMTVYARILTGEGGEAASAAQAVDEMGDSEDIVLRGSFSGEKTYTLALRAEGEGSIKVKGAEDDGGAFTPMLQESGRAARRNPALLYFAAGLLMLALTTKKKKKAGSLRDRKKANIPLGERLLPWGTFALLFGLGLLICLNKPVFDSGSPWQTWDEDEVHHFAVLGMLPGNAASLNEWLGAVITWYPGYLPLALGGTLAGFFTRDAGIIYRACILMSSLVYAGMAGLAVRHAPRYKATFLTAATLPAAVFQMTSRTYDTVVAGSILLGLALVLECAERRERITPLRAMTMTALMAFGTVAKPAYSLVLLSLLMIPVECFGGKKQCWIFRAFAAAMFLWCLAALLVPGAYDSVRGGDERFAGADAAGQAAWIAAHPWEGLTRPFVYFWENQRMLMIMGISHWAYLGNRLEWAELYTSLLLLAAPFCAFERKAQPRTLLTPGRRLALAGIALGTELVLIFTQFIVSSPVGGAITGMQARYFMPLWIALALALMLPGGIRKRIDPRAGGVMTAAVFAACAWSNISYALYWLGL